MSLDAGPSPDKWGGLRQEGHPVQNFFAKTDKCVIIINPYPIGRGPGYQRPPRVSHSSAPVEINIVKIRAEREEEGERREVWKGRRSLIRVGTLNIGTMTGRGRELANMMERKNVDILCLQEIKWKGSKARNIGSKCKIFYNGADGRKKWDRDSAEGGAG